MMLISHNWWSGLPQGQPALVWLLLVALIAAAVSPAGRLSFQTLARLAEPLTQRISVAIAIVGLCSFLLPAVLTLGLLGTMPLPSVHDEFSYLLAGQTFARGRLANPAHPMGEHLETIHIIHWPSYASKYPPGQGLALAAGFLLAGEPIVGVWISVALACAAVCWALYAWVPPRWALVGGLLCGLHPAVLGWSFTYWGGAVALIGGAVVAGAFGRLDRQPSAAMGAVLALGLGILANTRPFEGVLVSIPLLAALLVRAWRQPRMYIRGSLATVATLILIVVWMGYYNHRVTGHALQLPYTLHDRQYNYTPHFVFQDQRARPEYRHESLAAFHGEVEAKQWEKQQSLGGWAREALNKIGRFLLTGCGSLLLVIPLVAPPLLIRTDTRLRVALACILLLGLGSTLVTWGYWPHYAAPALPLWIALITAGMAQMAETDSKWRHAVLRALAVVILFAAAQQVTRSVEQQRDGWHNTRQRYIDALVNDPGGDLIVVRYLPGHDVHQEWVYNSADIDGSEIVWARDMSEKNQELFNYFRDRKKWLLEVDGRQARLSPYPTGPSPGSSGSANSP